MKKLIRIEFELKSPQEVTIFGYDEELVKKEIGNIFTPAGSGRYTINAIQVCGFKEAYDYWGCARYCYPSMSDDREKICESLEGKKIPYIWAKDIQLLFNIETEPSYKIEGKGNIFSSSLDENCGRCFNKPCTCDNKIDRTLPTPNILHEEEPLGKHENPYNVKRESEVPVLNRKDDLGCDYTYLDDVLIKKPMIEFPEVENQSDIQKRKEDEQEFIKEYMKYKAEKDGKV
jgi:hypothetical protein